MAIIVKDNLGKERIVPEAYEVNERITVRLTNDLIKLIKPELQSINNKIADLVQPKSSEEIIVEKDGTLIINKISTDKLEAGFEIWTLNGGDSN